jgi:hypothetical protein
MSNRNLTTDESERYNLSSDERYLITNYITQYNQTNNQINHLYTVLEELRHNIATIYNNSRQLDNIMRSSSTINGGTINRGINRGSGMSSSTTSTVNNNNTRNPRNNINMSIIHESRRNSYNLTDYINYVNNLYREINMIIPMTPIESTVRPLSQEEIAECTLTQPFSNFENPINTECPIRLEDFSENDMVTQIKKCGHIFNSAELTNWFQNNKCPVCRGEVNPRRERVARREQTTAVPRREQTTAPNLYNFDNLFDFVFRNIDTSNNVVPNNVVVPNNSTTSNNSSSSTSSSSTSSSTTNNSIDEATARY